MNSLRVDGPRRGLETAAGEPWFYLGDTAWALAHRLNREEAEHYLARRAAQGFNAIQLNVIAEHGGLTQPNQQGDLPLEAGDPLRPVERYFAHLDWVIERCNALGMMAVVLPAWGDKQVAMWGEGPVIFNEKNARPYAERLAQRWGERGVIWMLGGDRPVREPAHAATIDAFAAGIRAVVGQTQLITFHPTGGETSSRFVHDRPWLDFNTLQSGHNGRDNPNWAMIARDRAVEPFKPVLDAEPNYEDHPIMVSGESGWTHDSGHFNDHDVRKSFYRSVFAGAAGYTYGCHAVWQFFDPARNPPINQPLKPWRESLELPGARQLAVGVGLWKRLRALGELRPAQQVLSELAFPPARQMVAVQAGDGTAAVYIPRRQPVRLALPRLGWMPTAAEWINPRDAAVQPATLKQADVCTLSVECPQDGDWVLWLQR